MNARNALVLIVLLAVLGGIAPRAVAPLFSLFDVYADVAFPGGVHLERFTEAWGWFNAALDFIALADQRRAALHAGAQRVREGLRELGYNVDDGTEQIIDCDLVFVGTGERAVSAPYAASLGLEVDEKGTEAAAATAISMRAGSAMPTEPLTPAIHPAAVYRCDDPQQAADLLAGKLAGYVYSRDGHPNADLLAEKCREFNVTGQIKFICPGPVVPTYEFEPDPGVKYSRVTGLVDDLCLALKAESIRIDRMPGTPHVGIEVPNPRRETIFLREVIESRAFRESTSKLTIALGKTIDGLNYVSDLARMPHLLIAGTTGAGKSVGVNSLLVSILYRARPDEVGAKDGEAPPAHPPSSRAPCKASRVPDRTAIPRP